MKLLVVDLLLFRALYLNDFRKGQWARNLSLQNTCFGSYLLSSTLARCRVQRDHLVAYLIQGSACTPGACFHQKSVLAPGAWCSAAGWTLSILSQMLKRVYSHNVKVVFPLTQNKDKASLEHWQKILPSICYIFLCVLKSVYKLNVTYMNSLSAVHVSEVLF